jgi:hypothetical protein
MTPPARFIPALGWPQIAYRLCRQPPDCRFQRSELRGRPEGGYRFGTPYGGITPYAAIQAQPTFSELDVNNGGFALAFEERSATDTRSELGGRFEFASRSTTYGGTGTIPLQVASYRRRAVCAAVALLRQRAANNTCACLSPGQSTDDQRGLQPGPGQPRPVTPGAAGHSQSRESVASPFALTPFFDSI